MERSNASERDRYRRRPIKGDLDRLIILCNAERWKGMPVVREVEGIATVSYFLLAEAVLLLPDCNLTGEPEATPKTGIAVLR